MYSVPSNSVKSTKSLEVSSSTLIRAGFHKFTRLCYSPFGVLLEPGRWEDKLANGDLVISAENGLWMSAWSNGSSVSDYADGWALKKLFFFFRKINLVHTYVPNPSIKFFSKYFFYTPYFYLL